MGNKKDCLGVRVHLVSNHAGIFMSWVTTHKKKKKKKVVFENIFVFFVPMLSFRVGNLLVTYRSTSWEAEGYPRGRRSLSQLLTSGEITNTQPYAEVDSVLSCSLNSLQQFALSTLDIISVVSLPNPLSSNGCRPIYHNGPQKTLWTQASAWCKTQPCSNSSVVQHPIAPGKWKCKVATLLPALPWSCATWSREQKCSDHPEQLWCDTKSCVQSALPTWSNHKPNISVDGVGWRNLKSS